MTASAFALRAAVISTAGLMLSGCLATAVVGAAVGVTGAAVGVAAKGVGMTAKGAGMVVGAVIPGDGDKDEPDDN